ncbi:MAG: hypothetical protein GYA73_03360 [Planctomycetes bacterium]|nr:hypothetical protein [Planctomycetota bacterium]
MGQNGGAEYADIQPSMDGAADGETVLLRPGEYVITEPDQSQSRARLQGFDRRQEFLLKENP